LAPAAVAMKQALVDGNQWTYLDHSCPRK